MCSCESCPSQALCLFEPSKCLSSPVSLQLFDTRLIVNNGNSGDNPRHTCDKEPVNAKEAVQKNASGILSFCIVKWQPCSRVDAAERATRAGGVKESQELKARKAARPCLGEDSVSTCFGWFWLAVKSFSILRWHCRCSLSKMAVTESASPFVTGQAQKR